MLPLSGLIPVFYRFLALVHHFPTIAERIGEFPALLWIFGKYWGPKRRTAVRMKVRGMCALWRPRPPNMWYCTHRAELLSAPGFCTLREANCTGSGNVMHFHIHSGEGECYGPASQRYLKSTHFFSVTLVEQGSVLDHGHRSEIFLGRHKRTLEIIG